MKEIPLYQEDGTVVIISAEEFLKRLVLIKEEDMPCESYCARCGEFDYRCFRAYYNILEGPRDLLCGQCFEEWKKEHGLESIIEERRDCVDRVDDDLDCI